MGKLREKIWEAVLNNIVSTIFALIAIATPIIANSLPIEFIRKVDGTIWFFIAVFLLVVCLFLVAYVLYLRPKYIHLPEFGVYLDKNRKSYFCVNCIAPLQTIRESDDSPVWFCNKCKHTFGKRKLPTARAQRISQGIGNGWFGR